MSYPSSDFRQDAEFLYNHLLYVRKLETPTQLLHRVRQLFVHSVDYPEPTVLEALHRVALSSWGERRFHYLLNRCCYTLINHWWLHAQWWRTSVYRQATIELVELFKELSSIPTESSGALQVRAFVQQFTRTKQYEQLQRRAWIAQQGRSSQSDDSQVGQLIYRYPFLYPHYLMDLDSSEAGHHVVKHLQIEREQQFTDELFQYTNGLLRATNRRQRGVGTARPPQPIANPTLLSSRRLEAAIKQFAGKSEGAQSYQDLTTQFIQVSRKATTYRAVKGELHHYLTASIRHSDNPAYGAHFFDRWLWQQVEAISPQRDNLQPTDFLLVQTCGKLLDALIVNPYHRTDDHLRVFVDMVNNLHANCVIGLLLKIALICEHLSDNVEMVKAAISRRFSSIFRYYDSVVRGEVEWLIECLESLMVALSIHFGPIDFSWASLL